MAWLVAGSAAVSLIPSAFKLFSGASQVKQGKAMKPIDPGYQMNTSVIDNARILGERASNYQIAGYNQALQNMQASSQNAFNNGIQGASSGGDVLDLATKVAKQEQDGVNSLALQNAQGVERAQIQSLDANTQAGQEYVNKNKFDQDIYNRKLAEKAALIESGNKNIYGGIDGIAKVGSSAMMGGVDGGSSAMMEGVDGGDFMSKMAVSSAKKGVMKQHQKRLGAITPDDNYVFGQ